MDLISKDLSCEEVKALFLENNKRIMVLKNKKNGNSDEDFELKMRLNLEENLMKLPQTTTGLKVIVVDFPETYMGFTTARTYFEVAYSMIAAECANLGFVCVYGCTLDFGTRIYTINPSHSKVPVTIIARCEVYVLPSREEPGKDFVQEISNAWGRIIQERFGIEPEVKLNENLETRFYREIQQKIMLCENEEQQLAVLEDAKQVAKQLAHESVIFPEKFELLEKMFEEVQHRENVVEIKEKQLSEKEAQLNEMKRQILEKEAQLNEMKSILELKEQNLAEIQANAERESRDDGFDPAEDW